MSYYFVVVSNMLPSLTQYLLYKLSLDTLVWCAWREMRCTLKCKELHSHVTIHTEKRNFATGIGVQKPPHFAILLTANRC